MVSAPTQTVGPPAPTCTACCTPSPALRQKLPWKVGGQRHGVAPEKQAEAHQSQQRRHFGKGEDVLDKRARLHSENIDD